MAAISEAERLKRWRLVLGKDAEQGMGGALSYARMAVRTAEYRPDGSR